MYLQNSFYSNIHLYLNFINQYLKNKYELNPKYRTYDYQKNNEVTFIIFDIKTALQQINSKISISQLNYEGNLTFTYNKKSNNVIIKHVPSLNYNNKIKLPIFTQDLANILVNKLSNYIEKNNINLNFENILEVIAIDDTVKDIIPSIQNCKNYKILNVILETISKEIKKIKQDVMNQKIHDDRLDRGKEKAINKKRVILGINPLEYETVENFYKVLDKRIESSFLNKYNKVKRHLALNEQKYKNLLDNDKLYDYFRYTIFDTYLVDDYLFVDSDEIKETPLEFKELIENTRIEFKKYLSKYVPTFHKKVDFSHIKYYLDDWIKEENFFEKHKSELISSLYNFDLRHTLNLITQLIKSGQIMQELHMSDTTNYYNIQYKTLDSDEWIKWFCIELFNIDDALLPNSDYGEDKSILMYHPIFYDEKVKEKLEFSRKDEYLDIVTPFYKSKQFVSGFNLLQQIPKLIEMAEKYNDYIKNIEVAVIDSKTFSANWGNIINLPYWCILDESKHESGENYHEKFSYFMIKPKTKNIDLSKIKVFNRNSHQKLEPGYYDENIFDYSYTNRFMIFLPKSLEFTDIKTILNKINCNNYDNFELFANQKQQLVDDKDCSKWLNVICEDLDEYLLVKRYLIEKLTKEDNLPTRIFVNCDKDYYKNYLVNSPTGEILWHKYDYTNSNYQYKRKYLLDLRGQYNYANEYLQNILNISKEDKTYSPLLNEILFGSYESYPKDIKYINEFNEFLLTKESKILEDDNNFKTTVEYQKTKFK